MDRISGSITINFYDGLDHSETTFIPCPGPVPVRIVVSEACFSDCTSCMSCEEEILLEGVKVSIDNSEVFTYTDANGVAYFEKKDEHDRRLDFGTYGITLSHPGFKDVHETIEVVEPTPPVEATPCSDEVACPEGERCVDGICEQIPCLNCGEGEICVDEKCVPEPCIFHSDCPEGYTCVAGVCTPPEENNDCDGPGTI